MDLLVAILIWCLFGFIVGGLARFLVPGRQTMGYIATIMLGVAGSFLGGFMGYLLFGGVDPMQPTGFIGSLIGAIIVLLISGYQSKRIY